MQQLDKPQLGIPDPLTVKLKTNCQLDISRHIPRLPIRKGMEPDLPDRPPVFYDPGAADNTSKEISQVEMIPYRQLQTGAEITAELIGFQ